MASHSVKEWLQLHGIDISAAVEWVSAIDSVDHEQDPSLSSMFSGTKLQFESALHEIIIPALGSMFPSQEVAVLIRRMSWSVGSFDAPCAIDHGPDCAPEIRMSWAGSCEDLVCLAHEASHGLQLLLSANSSMPPIAREVCAFIGELALIDWVSQKDAALGVQLRAVWKKENSAYLGRDREFLRASLCSPESAYSYRLNYPLARAMAVKIFDASHSYLALFSAGEDAMRLLPFSETFCSSPRNNYLPPMPEAHPEHWALCLYRLLGASVLIDLDYWFGEAERSIADYYMALCGHLKDRSVFVGYDETKRPIGYVRWQERCDSSSQALNRHAAPFGNLGTLIQLYEQHIFSGDVPPIDASRTSKSDQDVASVDCYASVGYALELLSRSDYHGKFSLGTYFRTEILPAIWSGQARFHVTAEGVPTALVTWAWINPGVESALHETGRSLSEDEWNCGDKLFCNDWITPYGNIREVVHDMTQVVFPNAFATSLRRRPDGSVRRINRWTGANLRQKTQQEVA